MKYCRLPFFSTAVIVYDEHKADDNTCRIKKELEGGWTRQRQKQCLADKTWKQQRTKFRMWRKIKPYGSHGFAEWMDGRLKKIAERSSEKGMLRRKQFRFFIFYITCFIYRKTILASRPGNTLKFKMSCFELKKFMHTRNDSTEKMLRKYWLANFSTTAFKAPASKLKSGHRSRFARLFGMLSLSSDCETRRLGNLSWAYVCRGINFPT